MFANWGALPPLMVAGAAVLENIRQSPVTKLVSDHWEVPQLLLARTRQ